MPGRRQFTQRRSTGGIANARTGQPRQPRVIRVSNLEAASSSSDSSRSRDNTDSSQSSSSSSQSQQSSSSSASRVSADRNNTSNSSVSNHGSGSDTDNSSGWRFVPDSDRESNSGRGSSSHSSRSSNGSNGRSSSRGSERSNSINAAHSGSNQSSNSSSASGGENQSSGSRPFAGIFSSLGTRSPPPPGGILSSLTGFDDVASHSSVSVDLPIGGGRTRTFVQVLPQTRGQEWRTRRENTGSDISVSGGSPGSANSDFSTEEVFGDFLGLRGVGRNIDFERSTAPFQMASFSGSGSEANRAATATSSSTATNATGSSNRSSISFECCVCLENLDAPASIDLPATGQDGNPVNAVSPDIILNPLATGAGGDIPVIRVATARRGGSRAAPRSAAGRSKRAGAENVTLTDVVATYCGHLYHQVCLNKWFQEQGRRTCPSCRKTVPVSKLVRLYPTCSNDPGVRTPDEAGPVVAAGENENVAGAAGVESPNRGAAGAGTCAACQDHKDIHNTLMNDYNDLQERYNDVREECDLKQAQLISLEEDNTRKDDEIAGLKRQVEEMQSQPGTPSANVSVGLKRRRR